MIVPTAEAAMAHTSTAAAPMSLMSRLRSSRSAFTKSAVHSSDEFIISAETTMAITIIMDIHSMVEMCSIMPATTAHTAATAYIHELCSSLNSTLSPAKA